MDAKEFLNSYLENNEKFKQSVIYVYCDDIIEIMEKYKDMKIIEIIDECKEKFK